MNEKEETTMRTGKAAAITAILLMPLLFCVQGAMCQPPPVDAPLVREGDFAMKLAVALNIGQPQNEAEAESMLGAAGIAPRNGWMADYPVTPDIIGEMRDAVGYAAQAKTIQMDKDKAIQTLESVLASTDITMTPAPAGPPSDSITAGTPQSAEEGAPEYPDQSVVGDYYADEGPPILTYYAPPPDYYYLYEWVPYPFWWGGFWFGGFFILNDFHRHHHHGHFISNHFNDVNSHRVFRIDPRARFNGRTFAGIGAPRGQRFISPGVRGSQERIFNRNRTSGPRPGISGGTVRQRSQMVPAAPRQRAVNPFHESRVYSNPAGGGRIFQPGSGRTFQPQGPSRGFSAPRAPVSPPAARGGFSAPAPGGMGGGGGRHR